MHACAPGSREDAGDTGIVLAKLRQLSSRFGCAVLVVHHAGKDARRDARGSSSLEAAADVIIEVVAGKGVRTPMVRETRDGEPPGLQPFRIEGVALGRDAETGDPIRAGVHVLAEAAVDRREPLRAEAISMRVNAASFGEIARKLKIAKSTAEAWCKDGR